MTDEDKTQIWRGPQASNTPDLPDDHQNLQGHLNIVSDADSQDVFVEQAILAETQATATKQDHQAYSNETVDAFLSSELTGFESGKTVENVNKTAFVKIVEANDDATLLQSGPSVGESASFNEESTALFTQQDSTQLTSESRPVSAITGVSCEVGSVLKERFELLDTLGEGGMGMVFKALDRRKQEARSKHPYVAIKVLNPALARDEILVAGLQRESEKAQALSHPNIITVYDFDRDGDLVFMSMEYLSGQPLTKVIRDAAIAGGLKLDKAWPIIKKMGEALAFAHKKHIVHSDFKPANVFVTDDGEVKVLDFGIAAKMDHSDEGEKDKTVFDARMEGGYTLPYASLEMLNGGKADPRDDIYAFGLVVYEMLTGKHPYQRISARDVFFDPQRKGGSPVVTPVPGISRKQWRLLKSTIELLQAQRPKNLDEWLIEFAPKKDYNLLKAAIGGGAVAGLAAILILGGFFGQQQTVNKSEDKETPSTTAVIISPPEVNLGPDLSGKIGNPVVLDGSAAKSANGKPLVYEWSLQKKPEGSNSKIMDAASAKAQLIPDVPGLYKAELVVIDSENRRSVPGKLNVDVAGIQVPAPLHQVEQSHQASSVDGVLYLSAGKAQYHIGEDLTLSIRLAKSGYMRVAYVGAQGDISELLPNPYQTSKVRADVEYKIPPKANSFKLQVTGPVGVDRVIAVFSEEPLPKVAVIVNADGSLVEKLQSPEISTVFIAYDVVKKSS